MAMGPVLNKINEIQVNKPFFQKKRKIQDQYEAKSVYIVDDNEEFNNT